MTNVKIKVNNEKGSTKLILNFAMGEQNIPPKENPNKSKEMNEMLTSDSENPNGEDNTESNSENNDSITDEENDDMTPEEFTAINSQLDALNSALDDIEQKNDDIHAQLLQLLIANREIRKQLQEANSESKDNQPDQNSTNEPNQ